MKKYIIVLISLIIGLIVLIIIYQQVGIKDIFNQLSKLRWWQLFIIFFTSIIILSISISRWKFITEDLAHLKLPWVTMIKARLGELAVSYFTPIMYLGGEGLRAYILENDKKIPLNISLSSILVDRICEFIAAFIFIFFGAIFLVIEQSFIWGTLLFILAFIIFFLLYLIIELIGLGEGLLFIAKIFHLDKLPYQSKTIGQTTVGERLFFLGNQADAYIRQFHTKFYLAIIFSCLSFIIWFWQTKLLLNFFGLSLSWGKIFIIKIILILSGFIPIPADLGAYEGAHVLAFKIFDLPAETSIALSLVTRAFDLIWVSSGIFLVSHLVVKFLAKFSSFLKKS